MTQPERPMSPHIMIYRPQLTSILSIIHRGTGVGLAVGTLFITWWLVSAALGPGPYEATRELYGTWIGLLILFGFSVCLFYHLCNGVRHLLWDIGLLLEIEEVNWSGWVMLLASVGLTIVAWIIGFSL